MKFPYWFKIVWWVILLGIVTFFIIKRFDSIIGESASTIDIFIFLIWVSLLLVPLFQEISLLGVITLKKEMNSLKSYVREQVTNIRSDIQNSVDVQTRISPQFINLNPPLSDSQLSAMGERISGILEETLSAQGISSPIAVSEGVEIPENTQYLFSVRYEIEKELRRIWNEYFEEEEGKPAPSVFRIARSLSELEFIDSKLSGVIREIYKVCSPAIHGVQVSEKHVDFVRDVAPRLIASLKAIQ